MAREKTLSIIKPDAVARHEIGAIIAMLETAGLYITAARMLHLSKEQAEAFYAVHKARPFYQSLVNFMISGPVLVMVLEGEGAIEENRRVMGATDPRKAEPGTIRARFGTDIETNVVHGSDSPETAKTEVAFFFKREEIYTASI